MFSTTAAIEVWDLRRGLVPHQASAVVAECRERTCRRSNSAKLWQVNTDIQAPDAHRPDLTAAQRNLIGYVPRVGRHNPIIDECDQAAGIELQRIDEDVFRAIHHRTAIDFSGGLGR